MDDAKNQEEMIKMVIMGMQSYCISLSPAMSL